MPRRGGVDHLAGGVLGAESAGRALAELRDPFGMAGEEAPVVGDADGVDGVDVRAGMGARVDEAVLEVGAGDHGGDAHVEVGVGLRLGVHAGIAVDQAGDEELAGAVDNARALGDGNFAGEADLGDAAVANDDDGVGNIVRRAAPVGEIDDRAADENERDRGRGGLRLRGRRVGGEGAAYREQNREKAKQPHEEISLMRIVAHRGTGIREQGTGNSQSASQRVGGAAENLAERVRAAAAATKKMGKHSTV